jgi:hypothetical protein
MPEQNSQPNFGTFAMKSMPLLAALSEPLGLNLQRFSKGEATPTIANPPEFDLERYGRLIQMMFARPA